MISELMAQMADVIIRLIGQTGYVGIFLLMTVESALIPVPSEITMPFAGFLAYKGTLDLLTVVVVGTVGNLAGSLLAYGLGYFGHEKVVRTLIRRWGGYPEGVSYAILLMNATTPLIDRYTQPKKFGGGRKP